VHVPLTFTVRGGRKTIIGQSLHVATRTRFDDSLTKAIARAFCWQAMIEKGSYATVTELAKARGVNQSYACRLLRLTLMAPDIVEAILNHRAHHLTLDKLMKPLPASWREQQAILMAR
jgi:hypothetical protein